MEGGVADGAGASEEVILKLSGMVHLLPYHEGGESADDHLHEKLVQVNENLTCIHKAARSALENIERDLNFYFYVWQLQYNLHFLLTYCRCSLMVIFEEAGGSNVAVVNKSLYDLLIDIESYLSGLVVSKDSTGGDNYRLSPVVHFAEMKDLMPRIVAAYLAHYDDELNHQLIGDGQSMLDFCKHVIWDLIYLGGVANSGVVEEKFRYLTDTVLAKMQWKNYDFGAALKEMAISIQVVAYKVACYSFLTRFCRFTFPSEYQMIGERIESDVDIGVFKVKAVLLQLDKSAELGTEEFLSEYVDCVQGYLIQLLKDEAAIDLTSAALEDQAYVLSDGLLFLKRVIISHGHHLRLHQSELEKLSGIMVCYEYLLGNVGSVIYSCLKKLVKGSISSVLSDLIQKVDVMEEQTMRTILSLNLERMSQQFTGSGQKLFILLLEEMKDFFDRKSGLTIRDHIESDVGFRVLKVKALVLQLAESTTVALVTDEFLTEYVNSIQEYLTELLNDEAAVDQSNLLQDGLLFLNRVLICQREPMQSQGSEEEKLSGVRVRYKALLGNVGSFIYSYFDSPVKASNSSVLSDLIEKVDRIQEETIEAIISIFVGRLGEYLIESGTNHFIIFLQNFKVFVDHKSGLMARDCNESDVGIGLLKMKDLVLQLAKSTTFELGTDEIRAEYVNSGKAHQIQLLTDEIAVDLSGQVVKDQSNVLRMGLLFLKNVLLSHRRHCMQLDISEEDKLSSVRVRYEALLENIGPVFYSYFSNHVKGSTNHVLSGLIENVELMEEEAIEAIFCIVLGRMEAYLMESEADLFIVFLENFKEFMDLKSGLLITETKESDVGIRFLKVKALVLQLAKSATGELAIGEVLTEYVNSVKEYQIFEDSVDLTSQVIKDQCKVFHDGLFFLNRVLITHGHPMQLHDSEEKELSAVAVHYKAFLGNIGSFIHSCFSNQWNGSISYVLSYLIEKVEHIQEEAIETICYIMVGRILEHGYFIKNVPYLFILLLENLEEFMDRKSDLMITWNDQFEPTEEKLLLATSIPSYITGNGDTEEDSGVSADIDEEKQTQILITAFKFLGTKVVDEELEKYCLLAQGIALKMACYSLLRRCGNFSWSKIYSKVKNHVDSDMQVGILGAMTFSIKGSSNSSTRRLTGEHLVDYVDCIQCNLNELLKDKAIDFMKDGRFNSLQEGFSFLVRSSVLSKQSGSIPEKLSDDRLSLRAFLSKVGSSIFSVYNNQMKGIAATQVSNQNGLPDYLEMLNLLKGETADIISSIVLNRVGQESPRTDQLAFLNLLPEKYSKELISCESDLIKTWKDQLQTIHSNLLDFRSFIQNTNVDDDESRNLFKRVVDVGFSAEYLLNSFAVGACPVWCSSPWISDLVERGKLIKTDMEINVKEAKGKDPRNGKDLSRRHSHALVPTADDVMVGFEEEKKLIMGNLLASNVRSLDVVSIIGMAGLGKTTLAKKVYEDPAALSYFGIRAWCCVSQEYNKKDLFLSILSSIIELTDLTRSKSGKDLSTMVHKELTGRRYLIVVDDVWAMNAFIGLKIYFPDNGNGSRIVLTSRNIKIGLGAKCHSNPIELRFLTETESWDLLEHKIYGERSCPPELCQVGEKIAQKCSGLPLAIVLVAGFLPKSVQKLGFWEQVAENLSSYLAGDPEKQWTAALDLSYKYLPDTLKPLFLYLGAFPEDKEIHTDKLKWLWIAEGLVHQTEFESSEHQAETCLMDLIGRSLIMVAKRRSDGRVKSCHVHDLLRDMCLAKSKEDNFMHQVNAYDELTDPIMYQRRLSIFLTRSKGDDAISSSSPLITYDYLPTVSITPPLHTFLFFNKNKSLPLSKEATKSFFSLLKLLRVLHSESTTIDDDVYNDLTGLVYLRYMSIRTSCNTIPSSISSLLNMETLIIKGVRGEMVVAETVWDMVKLRNLHIDPRFKLSEATNNSSKLENLETLSTPSITFGEEDKLISKAPNLHKLRCVFTERSSTNFYGSSSQYPDLESLVKLESLNVSYYGTVKLSGEFKLPSELKRLSISKFRLHWDQISAFRNVEILKLCSGSVEGEFWDTGENEFCNLKVLKLKNLNVERWEASEENFPQLGKLVLERCKQLKKIPSGLGDIFTLERIEVLWCLPSTAKSAEEIQEKQMENGNVSMKVHIYPPDFGLRADHPLLTQVTI